MLVNCAGMAICGTIEDTKPEDAKFLIDLNYLSWNILSNSICSAKNES